MSESTDKMKLVIVIDGDSADELFAVGPVDLRDYFLPEKLQVKSEDVKEIRFQKVVERDSMGFPSKYIKHVDNFRRDRG